jgi:hypothetical protein
MNEAPTIIEKPKEQYCAGACRHESSYHQAKWFNKLTNDYKYGCCKVDCSCMEYKPQEKLKD